MKENDFESAITYTSYLAVDELLSLQRPLSVGPEHDEMLSLPQRIQCGIRHLPI